MAKKYLIRKDVTLKMGTQTLRYRAGQRKVLDDRIAKLISQFIVDEDKADGIAKPSVEPPAKEEAPVAEAPSRVEEVPNAEASSVDAAETSEEKTEGVSEGVAPEAPVEAEPSEEKANSDTPEYDDLTKSEWVSYGQNLGVKWSIENPKELTKKMIYAEVMAFLGG